MKYEEIVAEQISEGFVEDKRVKSEEGTLK